VLKNKQIVANNITGNLWIHTAIQYTQLSNQLFCMPVPKSTTFFYILYAIIYNLLINSVMANTLVHTAVFSSPSVLTDSIYNNVTIK